MSKKIKITVLTATLNADRFIGRLIDSLQKQSDIDFEWLIVDGGSNDRTLDLIKSAKSLNCKVQQGNDFGIYDALNRGISSIRAGYYLVVGSDDALAVDAIKNYRIAAASGDFDIITAAIIQGNNVILPRQNLGWFYGMPGVASSHSVGMIINTELHKKYGFYSKRFPIAADQLFIKTSLLGGAKILRLNFIAGEFSTEGTSGEDSVGLLTEVFRVQLLTESFVLLQYIIFFARLFKLYIRNLYIRFFQ
jgi:glycosyltransferase involved in cell wall biosynthesis